MNGTVVQELLDGTTGPKVYLDVGVCRLDRNGKWQIANGMMRLGGKGHKSSVTRKRATRLRRRAVVPVVVSRIYPSCARFEVVTDDTAILPNVPLLIPASTLKPGQELVGTVTRVLPFGVFVDVGANRNGLLHIQKVADLYQHYIDKEEGLEQAGLERGARIRVAVVENDRKRLFLDFTDDVKQQAAEEAKADTAATVVKESDAVVETTTTLSEKRIPVEEQEQSGESASAAYASTSEEEAAAWAAYAGTDEEEYIYEEDDGDYDEDKDIEDALGLGSY